VLPDGDVAGEALAIAQRIQELAPLAARANKRSFAVLQAAQLPPELLADAYRYAGVAEHREGITAFLEKRAPDF
jgi:1,4-dihydroxy-2-naphthoyl-CoA synthase